MHFLGMRLVRGYTVVEDELVPLIRQLASLLAELTDNLIDAEVILV